MKDYLKQINLCQSASDQLQKVIYLADHDDHDDLYYVKDQITKNIKSLMYKDRDHQRSTVDDVKLLTKGN